MDCSPLGSSVHGILQARILEWVALSFSRESSRLRGWTLVSSLAGRFFTTEPPGKVKMKVKSLSHVQLFVTLWTVAYQAPPTRLLCPCEFPGKNTGVGCPFLLQGIFPTQGSNLGLLHCKQMLYPLSHQGSPLLWQPLAKCGSWEIEISLAAQIEVFYKCKID